MNAFFPHRRKNALTGDWLLVSPQRTQRPWQGREETPPAATRPAYDERCYLCPGNARANGERNPAYESTYVFRNDFSALLPESPVQSGVHPLLESAPVAGECRVICFSPRHDLTLANMTLEGIRSVVDTWADQVTDLGRRYRWVQVFENKGELMGCSNPHPHGQIWASDTLPNEPAKEDARQREHFAQHGTPLVGDYLAIEMSERERVVMENAHWAVVVPYWAVWPYETLLVPKRHTAHLPFLCDEERTTLGEILRRLLRTYDLLFDTPFPYSMGWHGAPTDGSDPAPWWLHAHFYPPLLRSATVRKFMVGYEMLGEPQRDMTPEQAARLLREVSAKVS